MGSINLNNFIQKYSEYKDIILKLEDGTWRNDEKICNLSIEKIMNIKTIIEMVENLGISKNIQPAQRVD
jgi:hypothetical protein